MGLVAAAAHDHSLFYIQDDRLPLHALSAPEAVARNDADALTVTLTANTAQHRTWAAQALRPRYADFRLGLFAVCLHGSRAYDPLQRALVHLEDGGGFFDDDLVKVAAEPRHKDGLHVELFKWVAKEVHVADLAGVVITDYNTRCAVSDDDLNTVKRYIGDRLVLADQYRCGLEEDSSLWKCFGSDNVIANPSCRNCDFVYGGGVKAREYRDSLNARRKASQVSQQLSSKKP
jgi:hypothetical protein